MQTHPTPGLTAADAAERDQQVSDWLARIYALCAVSGCTLQQAIQAIQDANRQNHQGTV